MINIVLVCMANVCRSPMAATVLQHMVRDAGLSSQVKIDSAGTHAREGDRSPDARAARALADRQYTVKKSRSRQIKPLDFQRADMVIAMDMANLDALKLQCPPQYHHKLSLFLAHAPELKTLEVPDPYFGNQSGFERVLDLCEAGARGIVKTLLQIR